MHPVSSGYYVWELPERSERVLISCNVLEFIDKEVREAFRSVPRRGGETGGVLLGTILHVGEHAEIVIHAAEVISCEHRDGPSFTLSGTDREKIAEQRIRLQKEGRLVVGYFRSNTGKGEPDAGAPLSGEDSQLLGTASFFLQLRPLSVARVIANLVRCEGARAIQQTGYIPFPFESTMDPPPASIQAREIERTAHSPAAPRRAAWMLISPERAMRIWTWLAVLAVFSLTVGYRLVHGSDSAVEALDLDVRPVNGKLILMWDPKAPALRDAQDAALLIRDGAREKRMNLNHGQLEGGAASFPPATGTVTFSLETRTKAGRAVRGNLTYIDPSR